MSRLDDLLDQQKALEAEIKQAAKDERAEALKTVKTLIKKHKFTGSMLASVMATGRKRKKSSK
ncbi:MAG: H-NS family nucleoid-associated regulatory protein [Pseudomonadota bacterium]